MKLKGIFSLFLIAMLSIGSVKADTYPEVVFDNSLIAHVYAKSKVTFDGGSWVENVHAHLPVSDSVFFTPGNALSLRYENAPNGNWQALIRYSRQKFHYRVKQSDVLTLKLFVQSEQTTAKDLPSLTIKQRNGESTVVHLASYIDDYNTNTWLDIHIPMSKIHGVNMENPIEGIVFHQNGTGKHHVFVDQIEFLPGRYSKAKLSSPAVLSKVTAYDRHIHLQWQLPLTPSIRYVKIYRSEDNKLFEPIDIRPISMQGSLDYVPLLDKKYYYKIAWVDYDYKESPFSAVSEVVPTKLKEEELLTLVQMANVNYFIENYDVNSGMHLPFQMKERPLVSTKETGMALLGLIVGVERGYVSKNIFLDRVTRIVDFLGSVQNKHGIFAPFYDGREQIPIYLDDRPHYSVQSTTNLMEALLIVRQYLAGEGGSEVQIRNKITKLWENIDWSALLIDGQEDVLKSTVGVMDDLTEIAPLGGFGESINAYLLAAASPTHGIPVSGIVKNLEYDYDTFHLIPDSTLIDTAGQVAEFKSDLLGDMTEDDEESLYSTLSGTQLLKDTVLYGVHVPFGDLEEKSLLDVYRPFMTLNPHSANTEQHQLGTILKDYITYVQRRDNYKGNGSVGIDVWGYHYGRDSISNSRINPAISVSSIAMDPRVGTAALLALYEGFGEVLFTEYGFRAWIDLKNNDVSEEYMTINQAMVAVMIENFRSGLIWNLYDQIPEIKSVKEKVFVKDTLQ